MVKHINIFLMKWLYTNKNSFVIFFLIFYIFINFVFIHYKEYNTLLNKNVREFSTFFTFKMASTFSTYNVFFEIFIHVHDAYWLFSFFPDTPGLPNRTSPPKFMFSSFLQHTETNYILSFMSMGLSSVICAICW